jgi:hypothetical protein
MRMETCKARSLTLKKFSPAVRLTRKLKPKFKNGSKIGPLLKLNTMSFKQALNEGDWKKVLITATDPKFLSNAIGKTGLNNSLRKPRKEKPKLMPKRTKTQHLRRKNPDNRSPYLMPNHQVRCHPAPAGKLRTTPRINKKLVS